MPKKQAKNKNAEQEVQTESGVIRPMLHHKENRHYHDKNGNMLREQVLPVTMLEDALKNGRRFEAKGRGECVSFLVVQSKYANQDVVFPRKKES